MPGKYQDMQSTKICLLCPIFQAKVIIDDNDHPNKIWTTSVLDFIWYKSYCIAEEATDDEGLLVICIHFGLCYNPWQWLMPQLVLHSSWFVVKVASFSSYHLWQNTYDKMWDIALIILQMKHWVAPMVELGCAHSGSEQWLLNKLLGTVSYYF